jgi:hypothetical protein
MGHKRDEPEVRFWRKVNKCGPIARLELGPCWTWTGSLHSGGYGHFKVRGRSVAVHRYSYEINVGPIESHDVCHKCDTPVCVRPDHLFLGDARINGMDMSLKGRARGGAPSGERNGKSRLSEKDVLEIRRLCSEGVLTQEQIGQPYSLTSSCVSAINLRKTWRHI